MSTNIQIPSRFKKIFSALESVGVTDKLIAGGAVRDLYFGTPYRDIDVFIHLPSAGKKTSLFSSSTKQTSADVATPLDIAKAVAAKLGGVVQKDTDLTKNKRRHSYYQQNGQVTNVIKIATNEEPIELVFLKIPAKQYFDLYFDLGICKACYDGNRLHFSSDFTRDVKNKTFTIVGKTTPYLLFRTFTHHIRKLQKKFPGYEIRVDYKRVFT